jgi:hypothetical protein
MKEEKTVENNNDLNEEEEDELNCCGIRHKVG